MAKLEMQLQSASGEEAKRLQIRLENMAGRTVRIQQTSTREPQARPQSRPSP